MAPDTISVLGTALSAIHTQSTTQIFQEPRTHPCYTYGLYSSIAVGYMACYHTYY